MNKNGINLAYSGGSGGFLLLHLLLLSGNFYCNFLNKSTQQAIDQQWNVVNHNNWKKYESWPVNKLTQSATTNLNKIYFYCNPEMDLNLGEFTDYTVMIYTDYDSQHILAKYKKSHWYLNHFGSLPITNDISVLNNEWKMHYNKIRESNWPISVRYEEVYSLPTHVQDKILSHPLSERFKSLRTPVSIFHGCKVYTAQYPFLNLANVTIKLQDLVNSNGKKLTEMFDFTINDQQLQLIKSWKKLHPEELLIEIGIDP